MNRPDCPLPNGIERVSGVQQRGRRARKGNGRKEGEVVVCLHACLKGMIAGASMVCYVAEVSLPGCLCVSVIQLKNQLLPLHCLCCTLAKRVCVNICGTTCLLVCIHQNTYHLVQLTGIGCIHVHDVCACVCV